MTCGIPGGSDLQIGAMNHPREDVLQEIHWMAEMGLEFLDLTFEPPAAASWCADPRKIRRELERHRMGVIGHTAFYIPLGSPFEEVRQGAVVELERCLRAFAEVGAKWMNIHPDRIPPMHDRAFCIQQNLRSLEELMPLSRKLGVGIMLENLPEGFNNVQQLGDFFDVMPDIGLHLDIGHCNLQVPRNTAEDLIRVYGQRLRHVHIHDNKGGHLDLHLPIGAGNIDYLHLVKVLKASGYDGTITLEVFTPDRHHLAYSRDVLRRMWEAAEGT